MKHLLMKAWLCLSSILYICSIGYGQNHYIQANSVAGVEVRQGGGENSICPTYSSHFSTLNTTDKFYFTSMICQAAYVKLEIFNPTAGTIKATLTTTYGQAVETKTIATNSSTGVLVIPYNASYNWKFESVATAPEFIVDTLRAVVNVNKYVFPRINDIAVPANTNYRVKSGQTLSSGTLTADDIDNAFLLRPTSIGTQTIIVELYNASTNAIVGQSNLVVIVTQNCALGINSITQFEGKNYDIAISYNQVVDPYEYEIYNSAGLKLKTGTTNGDGNPGLKKIFIDDLPSGIYDFRLSSLSSNCGVVSKQFSYGNISDVCVMNASATRAGNTYNVTIAPIAGVSGVYYTLTNALDSVITEGIINSGLPLSLNFLNQKEGQYFLSLNPANSTKICFQKLSLPWVIAPTVNNRGYLKKYNNVPDYYEIAGIGDYAGVKDGGTGWVVKENRNVMLWQTYVKSLSNSVGAKALITFRQDSSSTSKHFSLAFEKGKIKIIQRTLKGGANVVSTEIITTFESSWLRFERNGNNLLCKISDSPPESDNPVFSTVATINNAFAGWNLPFWKGLYVSSGSSTTLAKAEFHRFLGGPYTGTTLVADNIPLAPPIIASSNQNPTANSSVVLTSSACKSGYLIQFYKNGVPIYQGSPYMITVNYNDSYRAKCEKGTDKSTLSNTITFTDPSNGTSICGIAEKMKLGNKAISDANYEIFARIFSNKLWVTQSRGTTPESFLVRGVNFLNQNFTKTWSGTNFSCFEGQTTQQNGIDEPSNFTTPLGYVLSTTIDGFRVYTKTEIDNRPTCLNGGSFTILDVEKTTGSNYRVRFTSSDLSSVNIIIKNSSGAVIQNLTQTITTNPQVVDFGTLPSGNYTAQFVGISCQGTSNAFAFVVSGIVNPAENVAPTIAYSPQNPTTGQSITLTSSGCASGFTNQFFQGNGTSIAIGNSVVIPAINAMSYYAKCVKLCESSPILVTVNVTNTNTCTDGNSRPNANSQLSGVLDFADCTRITGWCLNRNVPNEIPTVDIYINGFYVGTATANEGSRQDLVDVFGSKAYFFRKFTYTIPQSLAIWWKNGTSKRVTVKFGGSRTNLGENNPSGYFINCAGTGSGVCN